MKNKIRELLKKSKLLHTAVMWMRERERVETYSQNGEDIIINLAFKYLGIGVPSYIDIGANHPLKGNNTALFYKRGARGINIEPNPEIFKQLARARKEDINLNIGISDMVGEAEFYVFNYHGVNTFSREEADERIKMPGLELEKTIMVPIATVASVLEEYCDGVFPDLLSLDVEGMDEKILRSIDFDVQYPKVICVETVIFSGTDAGNQNDAISALLLSKGYQVFGSTHVNTIFCRR